MKTQLIFTVDLENTRNRGPIIVRIWTQVCERSHNTSDCLNVYGRHWIPVTWCFFLSSEPLTKGCWDVHTLLFLSFRSINMTVGSLRAFSTSKKYYKVHITDSLILLYLFFIFQSNHRQTIDLFFILSIDVKQHAAYFIIHSALQTSPISNLLVSRSLASSTSSSRTTTRQWSIGNSNSTASTRDASTGRRGKLWRVEDWWL